jgi:hypothetical protein
MAAGRRPKPIFPGVQSPWEGAKSPSPGPRGWRAASSVTPPMRSAKPSHRPRSSAASRLSVREPCPPRTLQSRAELSRIPERPVPEIFGGGRSPHHRPVSDPHTPRPAPGSVRGRRPAPREGHRAHRPDQRFVDPLVRPSLTGARVAAGRKNRSPRLLPAPAARRQPPLTGGPPNRAGRLPEIDEPVAPLVLRQRDLKHLFPSAVIPRAPIQPGLDNHAARKGADNHREGGAVARPPCLPPHKGSGFRVQGAQGTGLPHRVDGGAEKPCT